MQSDKNSQIKVFVILALFLGLAVLTLGPRGHTQSAQKIKSQDEIVREQMVEISRHLNVTCTECHKVENFKDSSKASFKVAKEHIQIVELLKSNGFDGKQGPLATCFMCHQGALKPAYKEGMKIIKKPLNEAPKAN